MFKRSIKTFILGFILGLVCVINVNAASLESVLEPGDIIIGNTIFRADDWISASRASKAGALYAMNTGETNVRVFYYDDMEEWYEYNDVTSKYELVKEPTLSELGDIIEIYYDNNEPLMHTYESYVEYEYDEEYDEYYPIDSNQVFDFFNWLEGDIFVDDSDVVIDYDDETITCPYQKVFDFEVVYDNEPTLFKGICGINDFEYVWAEDYALEKLEIESIELANSTEELINQDNVDFSYDHNVNIKIQERLEETSVIIEYSEYSGEEIFGNIVAFDINFIDENNCNYFNLLMNNDYSELDFTYNCIDENTLRVYLDLDNYAYSWFEFMLLDNMYSIFEPLYVGIQGMDRPNYDLSLSEIYVDGELLLNNTKIYSVLENNHTDDNGYTTNYVVVNTIGELETTTYNDISGKYIALDFILNDEVISENLEVYINGYTESDRYEILEDRVRIYAEYNVLFEQYMNVNIVDMYTVSENRNVMFTIIFNNYNEDYKIENYTNTIEAMYNYNMDDSGNFSLFELPEYQYRLLHNEEISTLYFEGDYTTIYKDSESLKYLEFNYPDKEQEEVIPVATSKKLEAIIYYSDVEGNEHPELYTIDYSDIEDSGFYYEVSQFITNNNLTAKIYTFLNPDDADLTNKNSELDKFAELKSSGVVKIIDLSSNVYETE